MKTYLHNAHNESIINFSIIMPVYNVEKFLRECLDSIVSQTLKEFEVICINDGSTDSSLEILQEYADKDSRFKVISQENQGQGIARNKGIELAKGKYLIFVDPDDFIAPDTFEVIYNKFKQTDAQIVQFDYRLCNENGKFKRCEIFKKQMKKHFHYSLKNDEIYNWHKIPKKNLQNMWLAIWNKAYRTDFIKSNNIKMTLNKCGEDHLFSVGANLLADKILYVNKILYYYRTRQGSAINKISNDNFCVFENIKHLRKFLIEHNLFEEYKTCFQDYALTVLCWHYSNLPTESINEYLKMSKELLNTKDYDLLLKKIKGEFSILEKIFSLKNQKINGVKMKYLNILGMQFKLRLKKTGVYSV